MGSLRKEIAVIEEARDLIRDTRLYLEREEEDYRETPFDNFTSQLHDILGPVIIHSPADWGLFQNLVVRHGLDDADSIKGYSFKETDGQWDFKTDYVLDSEGIFGLFDDLDDAGVDYTVKSEDLSSILRADSWDEFARYHF